MTILTSSGFFTGEGTPGNHLTGRTQAKRSSFWRSATFNDRIPPPTGVVKGPFIAILFSKILSSVF